MTLTFILTIHVTGPALGFPCFCRAWNSKTPSGPWFPPCRLHMQTSAPLSGSTAGRSQRMHFTPLASGRRLPALGVQVLVGALLEHPAGLSPSDVCSKADVPTKPKKKNPKKPPRICQHARDQVVLCRRRFSSCIALLCSGGCCPGIPLEEPQIAGRQSRGTEECAGENSAQ